ncbi:MAG: T9SS type A sorting domain-containing protein, partial [Bacteroidales bacterium]|nr:T9SS type A sorting domain-containing protein [Bacteroidales bacterium]
NDVVTIYDGSSTQDNILGEFSGDQIPDPVTSTGNQVLITFISDGSGTGNGWQAEFKAHSPDFCKGLETFTGSTTEFSDGSGNFSYHNGSTCMWEIIPDEAETVTLYFTGFDTENIYDKVKIYDLETQELLAEYSGSYSQGNMPGPVTSWSGKMFIGFSTNSTITKQGWSAYYMTDAVGVKQNAPELDYSIFPNPASEKLYIEVPQGTSRTIEINLVDLFGHVILTKAVKSEVTGGNIELDLFNIRNGRYILKIADGNAIRTYPVIKID